MSCKTTKLFYSSLLACYSVELIQFFFFKWELTSIDAFISIQLILFFLFSSSNHRAERVWPWIYWNSVLKIAKRRKIKKISHLKIFPKTNQVVQVASNQTLDQSNNNFFKLSIFRALKRFHQTDSQLLSCLILFLGGFFSLLTFASVVYICFINDLNDETMVFQKKFFFSLFRY